ncbi:MAG: hypothetical protein QF681_15150 [Vicinamibacterales bacterium]|jgi:hypothetical protein|nr:hypothetical protein [Vicinamibacterales bacterium]|tara:strand:- start:18 stop:278 length:261 start_codon:yes stop_codon:yes gene_type:complete
MDLRDLVPFGVMVLAAFAWGNVGSKGRLVISMGVGVALGAYAFITPDWTPFGSSLREFLLSVVFLIADLSVIARDVRQLRRQRNEH